MNNKEYAVHVEVSAPGEPTMLFVQRFFFRKKASVEDLIRVGILVTEKDDPEFLCGKFLTVVKIVDHTARKFDPKRNNDTTKILFTSTKGQG